MLVLDARALHDSDLAHALPASTIPGRAHSNGELELQHR